MFRLIAFLALFVTSAALADAPVIWNGTTAKWLPSGLQAAGMCINSAAGVTTILAPGSSGNIAVSNGSQWTSSANTAALSIAALDAQAANATGLALVSNALSTQSADATHPGVVNNTTQTLSGAKTFSSLVTGQASFFANVGTSATPGFYLSTGGGTTGFYFGAGGGTFAYNLTDVYSFAATLLKINVQTQINNNGSAGSAALFFASDSSTGLYRIGADNLGLTVAGAKLLDMAAAAFGITGSLNVSGTTTLNASLGGILKASSGVVSGSAAASDLSNGTTGSGAVVLASGPTMTNPIVGTQSSLDNSTKAASTAYVDAAIINDGPAKDASNYATTTALPTVVYANGSSGVGATLTGFSVGALSIDGASPSVGQRILVKNQVSTFENGIYAVTATGSGIAVFILTRTLDYDQSGDAQAGSSTFIISGTSNGGTVWDQNSASAPTIGTDPITFAQTAGPGSTTIGALDANAVNAQGLSFAGSVLSSQSADATHPGMVNTTTQTFAGQKTFSTGVTATVTGTASGNTTYSANNHGVVVSSTTNAMTVIAPNASTAFPLVSGGASADPSWALLTVPGGGTGRSTLTDHGVLIGAGASAITQLSAAAAGTLLGGVASSDPAFTATPTLGVAGTTKGTLAFSGNTSGVVTIQPAAAAGTYTLTLPTDDGGANQFLQTDGSGGLTWAAGGSGTAPTCMVHLSGGNGHGSTNDAIRRFATIEETACAGGGFTYADSSTDGASFTITADGVYCMFWKDRGSGSVGWSKNSAQLTTSVASITASTRFGEAEFSGMDGKASTCLPLVNGDVMRPHDSKGLSATNSYDVTANFTRVF